MTEPRYLVARSPDWTTTDTPPLFFRRDTAREYQHRTVPWSENVNDADRFALDEAARLRDDLADYFASKGRGDAVAVIEEIATTSGPAHRELTLAELAELGR